MLESQMAHESQQQRGSSKLGTDEAIPSSKGTKRKTVLQPVYAGPPEYLLDPNRFDPCE